MTCDDIERDEIAEQYLGGRLSEADQERFEAHYFDCAHCAARLQVLEEVRAELSRETAASAGTHPPSQVATSRFRRPIWRPAAAWLAAAAVIVLAVRIVYNPEEAPTGDPGAGRSRSRDVILPAPSVPPGPDLRALAEIQPPAYNPLRLRRSVTGARREFRDAMQLYTAGDYAGAAAGLRRAIQLDDSLVEAHFYLAVCVLQAERTEEGVQLLQRVIAFGESPYLEDAHFFLAKARLRQGDTQAARSELTRVIALRGERRGEAERLLAQIR